MYKPKHIKLMYRDKHKLVKTVYYESYHGGMPTEVFRVHGGRIKEILSEEEICER
jgi:hypothetical protein